MRRPRPLRPLLENVLDRTLLAHEFPGVQFDEPAGADGWFGPDSAIWYAHSHWSLAPGGIASLWMEQAMPAFASASVQHSKIYRGGVSSAAILQRLGESISYTLAVTFASAEVAEHATNVVRRMHTHVRGTLPDGTPYAADDAEPLRFAAVTLAHGAALGHRRYHPRPLDGSDLDDFYADWAVIGRAMGATDLPETRDEVAAYLDRIAPTLAVNRDTITALRMFEGKPPRPYDLATEPVMWAARDLLPDWARRLFRYPDEPAPVVALKRARARAVLLALQEAGGTPRPKRQALARLAATRRREPLPA